MKSADLVDEYTIAERVHMYGYVLLPIWRQEESTMSVGESIGSVVNIQALLPHENIPTVQTLAPRIRSESRKNLYSGTYGLSEFPLHTDLAHWMWPPRYFMLRCKSGSSTVSTRLLASSEIVSIVGEDKLNRALVRLRRTGRNGGLYLLPLLSRVEGVRYFRWDSLFLVPMNETARLVAEVVSVINSSQSELISISLVEFGDTLIVDNWRFLHGRSKVLPSEMGRKLERIYLSEIYQ